MQELLFAGCRQFVVDKYGIAQHLGDVFNHGGFFCHRFDTGSHHGVTEGTTNSNFLGARGHGLGGAVLIDAGAEVLLHEHAGATGTTAETFVAVAGHFHQLGASDAEEFPRWVEYLIMAA